LLRKQQKTLRGYFILPHSALCILGISWHQFVRSEEIAARTGLPPLSTTICCRRSAIFGYLARLGDEVPAHKALLQLRQIVSGTPPWSYMETSSRSFTWQVDRPTTKRQQPPTCWSMEAGY